MTHKIWIIYSLFVLFKSFCLHLFKEFVYVSSNRVPQNDKGVIMGLFTDVLGFISFII